MQPNEDSKTIAVHDSPDVSGGQIVAPSASNEIVQNNLTPQDLQAPATVVASQSVQQGPLVAEAESLDVDEVQNRGSLPLSTSSTTQVTEQLPVVLKPRSKNRIIILAIIVVCALIVAVIAFFLFRKGPGLKSSTQTTPDQVVSLSNKPPNSNLAVLGVGTNNQLLVNADVVTSGSLYLKKGNFFGQLNTASLTANRQYTLPDSSGALCLDSNNCNFLRGADLVTTSLGGVSGTISLGAGLAIQGTTLRNSQIQTTLNNISGAISIQGTANQLNVSTNGSTITLSAPQDIALSSTPTFAGISLTAVGTQNGNVLCDISNNCGYSGGSGTSFVQGGNSFGATATLGTNDSNSLVFETNNQSAITIASGGAVTLQNAIDSNNAFTVKRTYGDAILTVVTGGIVPGVILGNDTSAVPGILAFHDGAIGNVFAAGLIGATLYTGNRTIVVPDESGTLCLQASANCGFTTGAGQAFVQNGNTFGVAGTLGTNDGNSLNLETNNVTRLTVTSSGDVNILNDATISSQLAVGSTAAITANQVLRVNETYTNTSGITYGIRNSITADPSAASTAVTFGAFNQVVSQAGNANNIDWMIGAQNRTDHTGSGTLNLGYGSYGYTSSNSGNITTAFGTVGQVDNASTTATFATASGVIGNVNNNQTGTITTATGLDSYITNLLGGTIVTANGVLVNVNNANASGVITTLNGINIQNATNAGTITTNYGINVASQTAGLTDYGIAIGAADTQTLWLSSNADNTTASAGVAFGLSRDTNLYRSAVTQLKTDGDLVVGSQTAVGSTATISANTVATFSETYTGTSGSQIGIGNSILLNPAGTSSANNIGTFTSTSTQAGNNQHFTGYNYGSSSGVTHNGTGTVDFAFGNVGSVANTSSGTVAIGYGTSGVVQNSGNGIISFLAAGLEGQILNTGSGTINAGTGLFIAGAINSGGGTLGTNTGILVQAQTVGTVDYGISIEAADTQTLWLSSNADNTTASAGVAFGLSRDTNLYRSAAGILKTDTALSVGTTITLGSLGTTDTSTLLCRNSSNQIAGCNTTGSGAAFVQGGNSFGATAVLGTNDANGQQIKTNNIGRAYFDTSNNLYLGNADSTGRAAAPNDFNLIATGSSTAGTRGGTLSLSGGSGATTGGGSNGGDLLLNGGNAGGSGNNDGGWVIVDAGARINSGAIGGIAIGSGQASSITIGNSSNTASISIDSGTGAISIGTTAQIRTTNIATGVSTQTVTLGSTGNASSLTLQAGTGGIGIGTSASARSINIGTGAAAQAIVVGSTTGASSVTIQSGTGALLLTTQGTGGIGVGTNAIAQTITIGNSTGATAVSVNCGTGNCTFGSNAIDHATIIGSSTGVSALSLVSGSGAVQIQPQGTTHASFTGDSLVVGTPLGTGTYSIYGSGVFSGTGYSLLIAGSASLGGNGGNVSIQGGSGSAVHGVVNIGVTNTSAVNIGSGTGSIAVSVSCGTGACGFGNNAVAHTTTIGSNTGASVTTIQAGTGGISIGDVGVNNTIQIGAASQINTTQTLNIGNNSAGTSNTNVVIGSTNGTSTTIIKGGSGGISIGDSTNNNTIQIGASSQLNTGQTINIGNNNAGTALATNVTIGSTRSSSSTTIQAGTGELVMSTAGVERGRFTAAGNLILGNGVTAATPSNVTVQGTGSTTAGNAGGALSIIAGAGTSAGTGSNGGALTLQGGAADSASGTGRTGGAVNINGGLGSRGLAGGAINLTGGTGGSSAGGSGGNIAIAGGLAGGGGSGGSLTLSGGAGTTGSGGGLNIFSGNSSSSTSGSISLDVGTAGTTTGTISIGTNNASSTTIGNTTGSSTTNIRAGSGLINLATTGADATTVAQFNNAGATTCTVQPGGTGFACSSDARLKTNVATVINPLETIKQLRGVTFNWISNPGGQMQAGFIAQELEQLIPSAVSTDNNGYKVANYTSIIPYLVGAAQAQDIEITGLQRSQSSLQNTQIATNDAITTRVSSIEQRVSVLESQQTQATNSFASLNVSGPATIQDLRVVGSATIAQLTVTGNATIAGNLTIQGHVLGNSDTRGSLTIPAGQTELKYTFTKPYTAGTEPNVILTPRNAFAPSYRVVSTDKDFTVYFESAATTDVIMNYQVQE